MSEPVALFGLTVKPGEVHRMDVLRDFRITNVSLGENVKGDARVVVKVHIIPQSGHPLTEEEELLEGLMDDSDDSEDDDDDDDDDVEEGDIEVEEVDDEEDDEEDEDEDDDDDDDDEEDEDESDEEREIARAMKQYPERSFVLCTLTPGKIEQVAVNINFSEAEEIGFSVTGDNEVDLLGNYVAPAGDFDQDPYSSDEYDSEIDSDEAGSWDSEDYDSDDDEYDSEEMAADGLEALLNGEDSDEDEDDSEDSERFENVGEELLAPPSKKRKAIAEPAADVDISMASSATGAVTDAELAKAAAAEGLDVSKLSKAQRKRLNKKLKLASDVDAEASVASTSSKPETIKAESVKAAVSTNGKTPKVAEKQTVTKDAQQTSSSKTKTASGLLIEVKKQGDGAVAKKGQKAGMRYIGKLTSGKVFDSNTKGKPFFFKLGKGEVIKAWDEGVLGMKIGEERRLTCPPALAYGPAGAPPDIPRNATLVFDIKLVDLK